MNLENKEIHNIKDLLLDYEAVRQQNACLKARCRTLSRRNLFLETKVADLEFAQKCFYIDEQNRKELDQFLAAEEAQEQAERDMLHSFDILEGEAL